jgi:pilus assembly protein CpaC
MQVRKKVLGLAASLVAALSAFAQAPAPNLASANPPVSATPQQAAPPAAPAPFSPENNPPQEEATGAAPIRVMVGKSVLINTRDRLRRVSVTDPAIADAMVVTPTQVLIHGRAPGEVSLIVWDESEHSRSFDLRVDLDVSTVSEEIKKIFPDQTIAVSASRNAIVLSGHVATKDDAERAGMLAGAYSKNVVNVLSSGPVGAEEVLLEVKFAEVDRTALTQWGFNLLSTGAARTVGATSTQQFGPFSGSNVGVIPPGITPGTIPVGNNLISGGIGGTGSPSAASIATNNLLNIFLFRPDLNLGAVIQALQQKNILQILAEPNLIAVNGKESSFLAGGEFPFPVVQSTGGYNAITIQFKEFGVRLKFSPVIMPTGNIHLRVQPEVSALDFSNALTISGFTIPALSTRRADTELELQDGQSFVIAGLLDNRLTDVASKIPGLGNLPILGNFFKSKNLTKSTSELMVLVTAHRISPTTAPPPLPKYPEPFMDQKSTEKPAKGGM